MFALLMTLVFGMVAVVIDLGLLFSQRRFDQNGADAASLAVVRKLASNVVLGDGSTVYFDSDEREVYELARYYAGLPLSQEVAGLPLPSSPPTKLSDAQSTVPEGRNQSAGLTSRNRLAVTVEYKGTEEYPTRWCYSMAGPEPLRSPGVPWCQPNGTRVPLPSTDEPFRVRVTVSSTTEGFFTPVFTRLLDRQGYERDDFLPSPPALYDDATPACILPQVLPIGTETDPQRSWGPWPLGGERVPGDTVCAHAVAVVRGNTTTTQTGRPLPVAIGDCRIQGVLGELQELWSSGNNTDCPTSADFSINNVLDFTDDTKWCDGVGAEYTFTGKMPVRALGQGSSNCPAPPSGTPDDSWNRDANHYTKDPDRAGSIAPHDDLAYWIARGFGGTLKPCTYNPLTGTCPLNDGVRLPLFAGATGGAPSGNGGQNVADGFYCGGTSSVAATTCSTSVNPAGTYFFAKNQPGYQDECDDDFGRAYHLGCREAQVLTWTTAQGYNKNNGTWVGAGNGNDAPVRVQVARYLTFRFYCKQDPNTGSCSNAVQTKDHVPGVDTSGNNHVYGRFVAPFIGGSCSTCTGAPSVNGNWAGLDS
jgi:hypothetical protein